MITSAIRKQFFERSDLLIKGVRSNIIQEASAIAKSEKPCDKIKASLFATRIIETQLQKLKDQLTEEAEGNIGLQSDRISLLKATEEQFFSRRGLVSQVKKILLWEASHSNASLEENKRKLVTFERPETSLLSS